MQSFGGETMPQTRPDISFLTQKPDDALTRFFSSYGFTMSWDFSKHNGCQWHEVLDKRGKMYLQIEMGVSVARFIHFVEEWARDKRPDEIDTFFIASEESPAQLKEFFSTFYDFERGMLRKPPAQGIKHVIIATAEE